MSIRVLVTGASGFVGSRLTTALVAAGHQVRAMTRHPDTYSGAGEPVFGDVSDSDGLRAAMDGVDAASTSSTPWTRTISSSAMPRPPPPSDMSPPRPASGKSSISVASATSTTTCRRTCGRAGTSSSCSHSVGCR